MNNLDQFPRLSFGHFPTPLEEMPRLRAELGPAAPRLLVKRDDYSGPGFGGNKVRKLEFVLAQAMNEGADSVVTTGGVRSNSCRITAAISARLGLECHLVLNGSAAGAPASLYLDELYGAHLHFVSSSGQRAPAADRVLAELRSAGRRPYLIPLGASIPLGALGYVNGALEIVQQGASPNAIYFCSSSGGTHAGLEVGMRIFGLEKTHLVGVSPDDPSAEICTSVARIVGGLEELLGVESPKRALTVDDRFVGPGYGIPTPESESATRLVARTEGIILDPVYTAKTMVALIEAIRGGRFKPEHTVLFWHTGGQMALFTHAAAFPPGPSA